MLVGGLKQSKVYKFIKGPSIEGVVSTLTVLDLDFLTVNQKLCPNVRLGRTVCDDCIRLCPTGAIEISSDEGISIDTQACLKCGICGPVCPNGVFEPRAPSDEVYLRQISLMMEKKASKTLTVRCDGINGTHSRKDLSKPRNGELVLPCLGRMSATMMLWGQWLSGGPIVYADCDEMCPHRVGLKAFDGTSIIANHLAETINASDALLTSHKDEGHPEGPDNDGERRKKAHSRRDFFGGLREAAASTMEPSKEKTETKEPHWHHKVPVKRQMLVEFARTGGCSSHLVSIEEGLPFIDVSVDPDRCDLCGTCSALCPTGALSSVDLDKLGALVFTFWKCTGCGLCQTACPERAVELTDTYDLALLAGDAEILVNRPWERCSTCGTAYIPRPEEDYCPQCDKRAILERRLAESLEVVKEGSS
jgi:ferredoxin